MTVPSRHFADVSAYQPDVNMHDYAQAGHILIAIKATEGLAYVNPHHRGQALAAGLRHIGVVHYHFARPDQGNDPAHEAAFFLAIAHNLLGPHDYVVLDLERATPGGYQHDPAWSRGFDQHIRDNSRYRTILYANRATLSLSDQWLVADPKRVHEADWSTNPDYAPPGYTVAFRQYTDGVTGPEPHTFAGIGQCDGNVMSNDVVRALKGYR